MPEFVNSSVGSARGTTADEGTTCGLKVKRPGEYARE
jgi:hypothetical protein